MKNALKKTPLQRVLSLSATLNYCVKGQCMLADEPSVLYLPLCPFFV